ncbi:MAG: outer membrane protein assembly factor BamA [Deltaproteobacteria bacterium]|nr:outer membrane protein assembly factor BamA [Deltaproteobacteria bacterium]
MIVLLALLLSATAFAQDTSPAAAPAVPPPPPPVVEPADTGAPVVATGSLSRVEVKGLRRVEEAAILDAIGLRAGDMLAPWKVERDIKAIWATGYVDDVVVRATPGEGGVVLTFVVTEKPAVREVKFSGNKKIKDDDLKEAVDITALSVPSDQRIAQNARTIRDKYLEKGFYLATVEPVSTPAGPGMVDLEFKITENRKVIVQEIDITGNEGVPDAKIKRFLSTKEGGIVPWLTSTGNFIEENLENDVYVVRSVLLEEGYVEAQVDEPKVFLSPDKRHIFITIHVTEGPQYQIGKVNVRGDFVPEEGLTQGAVHALVDGKDLRDVQEAFERDKEAGVAIDENWAPKVERRWLDFGGQNAPLETGDTFKLTTMQAVTQRVSDLYGDQGYAFANIVPLPQPDPESKVVDLTFDIQKGDKMRIGHINITGNDPTFDKVVRREIPINEGEVYAGSRIREARERLERLGFFETVEISTPRGGEADELEMNVDVAERPTGSFTVGAGFSSVDSFLLTANIQKSNFFGLGWVVSVAGNISKPTQTANLDFYDPYFFDSRWTLRLSGYVQQQNYIENEYRRGGLFQVGRYLDARDDIRLAMDYTIEDNGLLSLDEYKERLYGGQLYRNGVTSSAGVTFEVDKRNNRINATRGIKFTLSTELAGGFRINDDEVLSVLGGDFNYWESKANFRFYQPLVKDDWLVFKYNMSAGHIQSTDGSIVPYIHRYRAGGITSIRGFATLSLGPSIRASGYREYANQVATTVGSDDPQSADDRLIIGGTETFINNFELESPIIKAAGISFVTFFDAGNTFGDVQGEGNIDLTDLRTSVGFGIRWFSPIGPLRFEWGFPLEPYPDERKAVFDFTIGSAF